MRKLHSLWHVIQSVGLVWGCIQPTVAQSMPQSADTNQYIERRYSGGRAARLLTGYPQPPLQATASFPLVVSLTTGVFNPGEPILVSITTTNTLGKLVTAYWRTPEEDYQYQVTFQNKAGVSSPVAWTAYGKSIFSPNMIVDGWVSHFYSGVIRVGETRTSGPIFIGRLFDMSQSGTYVVHISQRASMDGKDITLSAMPVTITVN